MEVDLPLREVSVGTDNYRFVFPAPRGWSRLETSSNEVKYKKAQNPTNTYILRVEQVISQHEQIPDMVEARVQDLRRDEEQVHIPLGARTYDSLEVSYVHDGYRRFALYTWLDITRSGQAEAEIAITGREKDLPGMRDLRGQGHPRDPRRLRRLRAPTARPSRARRWPVARSAARTCTHSSRLAVTWTTRSIVMPPWSQPVNSTVM